MDSSAIGYDIGYSPDKDDVSSTSNPASHVASPPPTMEESAHAMGELDAVPWPASGNIRLPFTGGLT